MLRTINCPVAQRLYAEGRQVFYIDYHSEDDKIKVVDLRNASKEYVEQAWQRGNNPYGIDKNARFFIITEER